MILNVAKIEWQKRSKYWLSNISQQKVYWQRRGEGGGLNSHSMSGGLCGTFCKMRLWSADNRHWRKVVSNQAYHISSIRMPDWFFSELHYKLYCGQIDSQHTYKLDKITFTIHNKFNFFDNLWVSSLFNPLLGEVCENLVRILRVEW